MLQKNRNYQEISTKSSHFKIARKATLAIALSVFTLATIQPAFAHHPFGGQTPTSFIAGFLSGAGLSCVNP